MTEDTDSEWDSSTLDFSTTPQPPVGFSQQPRIEMDVIQETSEHSSVGRPSPKPLPRTKKSPTFPPKVLDNKSISASLFNGDNQKEGLSPELKQDNSQTKRNIDTNGVTSNGTFGSVDNKQTQGPPPYNFGGMYKPDGEKSTEKDNRPGKDRKGRTYEPEPHRSKQPKGCESDGLGSWDDSEAEERVMQQVRETFNKAKSRGSPPYQEELRKSGPYSDDREIRQTKPQTEKQFAKRVKKQPIKKGYEMGLPVEVSNAPIISESAITMSDLSLDLASPPCVGKYITQVTVKEGVQGKRYIYHFDKGNMKFYEVEDVDANAVIPPIADKVEKMARRGFQEFFGVLKIMFVCLVLFLVELLRFVFGVVIGPLVSGVLATVGNYFFKPAFVGLFNAILQPLFTLLWNTFTGLRHVLSPLFDISKNMVSQAATILQAFRLVEINHVMRGSDNRDRHAVQIV